MISYIHKNSIIIPFYFYIIERETHNTHQENPIIYSKTNVFYSNIENQIDNKLIIYKLRTEC